MLAIQLTVKDMPSSAALEAHVREKAQKIKQYHNHILSCRMTIGMQQKHKHRGKLYYAHMDANVPGKKLVVSRQVNEDVYVAIRDAINALERQLETHADKLAGRVKHHEA